MSAICFAIEPGGDGGEGGGEQVVEIDEEGVEGQAGFESGEST